MRPTRFGSVALVGLGLAGGVALSNGLPTPSAVAREHPAAERNPRIHHALEALHDAAAELEAARNDFHGHKRDAQEAVHHAIDELDRIKDW